MRMKSHFFGTLRWAACAIAVAFLCFVGDRASAQSLDNKGDDFIISFLPNVIGDPSIQVHLTSDVSTSVTVEYPVNAPFFTTTVPVTPGTVTIVTLPQSTSSEWSPNSIQNNCVRAYSTDNEEFVCYLINIAPFTSDAALGLPIDTMNTTYMVMDYNPTFVGSQFVVYAAFDNTTVTITPRTAIMGHPAGVPFNFVLNRGEGYYALGESTGIANFLSGTTIEADRPIGVVNGNGCHQVPTGYSACDHTFEVAQPLASWGKRILVANLPLRSETLYRIVASQDNTTVTLDGAPLAILNRGDRTDVILGGNHVFEGDNSIYVAQYMTGQDYPGGNAIGDPAMGNMIPTEQYLENYTFSTVGGDQFLRSFVTVIAQNGDIGSVLLDGLPIPAGLFVPIPASAHSAAIVELTSGTHTTASPNPHGITVEGYNQYDSYIYPGGALFKFIDSFGDKNSPICQTTLNAGPPPSVSGTATDNRPTEDTNGNGVVDPGEDLNSNGLIDVDTGIFFVQLAPGAVNLTLTVDPFIPGDPVVTYQVTLTDPTQSGSGMVVVTDGAGNDCSSDIRLTVDKGVPPEVGAVCVRIASSTICTLDAEDDETPVAAIKIWVLDTATPAFLAGPYSAGKKLVIRKNPVQAPYARSLSGAYTAQIQVRGQASLVAEDEDGLLSAPVVIP